MRRLLLLLPLLLLGCKSAPEPQPVLMTPSSRLIFHDSQGHALWSFCDFRGGATTGARVYMTHSGSFWVVPGGCPDGNP